MTILMAHFPENSKDTLCRNIVIYGRCRYEDKGTLNFPAACLCSYDIDLTGNTTVQAAHSTMTPSDTNQETNRTG